MYSVHGQDFINGFLGLHNVTRATQSEHPEDNVWWYYLAIFLGASMPWTGAVIYGIIAGFKQRHTGFIYIAMCWGDWNGFVLLLDGHKISSIYIY